VGRPSSRRTDGGGASSSSSHSTRTSHLLGALGERQLDGQAREDLGATTVHSASFSLHLRHGYPSMKRRTHQKVRLRRDDSNVPSHLILRLLQREHATRGGGSTRVSRRLSRSRRSPRLPRGATLHSASFSLHLRHGYPSTKRRTHQKVTSRRDDSDVPSHLSFCILQRRHARGAIRLSRELARMRARSSCCSSSSSVISAHSSSSEGTRTFVLSSLFSMFGCVWVTSERGTLLEPGSRSSLRSRPTSWDVRDDDEGGRYADVDPCCSRY
jgi:hypothetical protein